MDRLKQLQTFVAVANRGTLAAAAAAEGVVPAVIGRRLDALEARLGVRLFQRTTRRLSLTAEGGAFLEDVQRVLGELEAIEGAASAGGGRIDGHLRVTAPAGFGRKHVAPWVPGFVQAHPGLSFALDLTDRIVDLVHDGYDCGIRIGDLPDSSLVSFRLAENRRLVVAAPDYLARRGTPATPDDLRHHDCLGLSGPGGVRPWLFAGGRGGTRAVKVPSVLDCSDASAITDWARAGHGLAWRSLWEVEDDLGTGALVAVLTEFAAPANGIYAVVPQRKHLPARVRAWVDWLRQSYASDGRLLAA
ncbi:LysR family transcriptional regulator [Derxia gummosa]|uniref:LysR family transcriptional regulator n=1 Tax=Derxia gummosa DSM 723 TaxID=1121388 RepID=A0A8B6X3I9_9BURK|nr:LysR family transcriptional regulator [Derxia gummosa]